MQSGFTGEQLKLLADFLSRMSTMEADYGRKWIELLDDYKQIGAVDRAIMDTLEGQAYETARRNFELIKIYGGIILENNILF